MVIKILIIIAAAAYIIGGVGVFFEWYRAYQDTHTEIDPIFIKLMFFGFIGLWVFFLLACWYVNRRDEVVRFIQKICRKY